jgi:uncharacterized paraquat-inducible protein A
MNCPHCQKELATNDAAARCPFCGRDLPREPHLWKRVALALAGVFMILFSAIMVLIGAALVMLAVLYAGCVCSNGGRF